MHALVTVIAIFSGIVVATQPLNGVATAFATIAFLLLFAISPLSAMVIVLIFAPLRALISAESIINPPLDIGQITALIFVATWTVHRIRIQHRLTNLTWSNNFIPIIIFIACSGISVFTAHSLGAWLSEWLKWLFVLIFAVIVLDVGKKHDWQYIVFALVIAGAANALIGLYIFLGGSGADHFRINDSFFRAFGTFGQPNPFGGFMGLLAPIALLMAYAYFWINIEQWHKSRAISLSALGYFSFYGLSAGLLILALVASWSRGAWLSFAVSMGVISIALPRKLWQSIGVAGIVFVSVFLLWSSNRIPASIMDRIESATRDIIAVDDIRGVDITTENYAVVERLAHWQAATNMISEELWMGVGFGNYEAVYNDYRLINWDEPLGHAHNYYLNVLAETGIIGFLGYMFMWLGIVWFTWRCRSHPDLISRCVSIGLLGTWTYLSVHSLTDNLFVNNIFLHIGVMIGIVAILYAQTSNAYRFKR
ncbi:MAG: O-antigen ligase family protein [Aggregatilineales bacterium]